MNQISIQLQYLYNTYIPSLMRYVETTKPNHQFNIITTSSLNIYCFLCHNAEMIRLTYMKIMFKPKVVKVTQTNKTRQVIRKYSMTN